MEYKNLQIFLNLIYENSPLQKKKIERYLKSRDNSYFENADQFAFQYADYLRSESIPISYATDAYLKMCNNMMRCQVDFMKTGKYPASESREAFENVYNNEEQMKSYMIGLALSQFLWSSHYEIFKCFKEFLGGNCHSIQSYLEIGPGHGLFLGQALKQLTNCKKFEVVDISSTSIGITKSIVNFLFPRKELNIRYYIRDMLELSLNDKFDFIAMGEVIEHVNFPDKLLVRLRNLLSPSGKAFVSTCVDCPAVDHVYHFKSVDEIRQLLKSCGLEIIEERICPVEDFPMEEIIRRKITINYCCIVQQLGS